MRNPNSVICILARIVNRLWDGVSMCDAKVSQFIGHYFPGSIMMMLQQTFKKALGGLAVASRLQKHIDHLAVLINGSPQVLLRTLDLHERFVDEYLSPNP